jgi:hypothetical protein
VVKDKDSLHDVGGPAGAAAELPQEAPARRADQRDDHDEAFLDRVFWWYLATVELINRLIASRNLA